LQAISLKAKVVLIFFLMITLTFVIEALNLTYIKLPQLYTLEANSDRKDINRIKTAFDSINQELSVVNYDNAVWYDTYQYIIHRDSSYTLDNFVQDTYKSINLNGIHIYDIHGNKAWGKSYEKKYWQQIPFAAFDSPNILVKEQILSAAQRIDNKAKTPISHSGFVMLEQQLVHFSATLITTTNLKATPNGTMVFWRFVDHDILTNLRTRAAIAFNVEIVAKMQGSSTISPSNSINGSYRNKEGIIKGVYPLINDDKVMVFSYQAPARLFETHLFNQSVKITFTSLLLSFSIIYLFIHFYIVYPIINAKKQMQSAIKSNNHSLKLNHARKDELGMLFYYVNRLLENISSKEQELISHNLRLQEISHTDGLTKIANRRAFDDYMHNLLQNPSAKSYTTLLVCDVDYFKKFNDFYGHAMGDNALKLIAKSLERNLHAETDFVARYGGEEFVVVLNNTNEEAADFVSKNLLEGIKQLNIPHEKSDIADIVTLSIGSHSFKTAEYNEHNILFEKADKALYLAKSLGRNRACSSTLQLQFNPT